MDWVAILDGWQANRWTLPPIYLSLRDWGPLLLAPPRCERKAPLVPREDDGVLRPGPSPKARLLVVRIGLPIQQRCDNELISITHIIRSIEHRYLQPQRIIDGAPRPLKTLWSAIWTDGHLQQVCIHRSLPASYKLQRLTFEMLCSTCTIRICTTYYSPAGSPVACSSQRAHVERPALRSGGPESHHDIVKQGGRINQMISCSSTLYSVLHMSNSVPLQIGLQMCAQIETAVHGSHPHPS